MTVNHAWNTGNSIADIANDLKPALSEKIDRAKIKVEATAGVAKATRDFANFKDRKYPIPETISGHSQIQMNVESDWQPRQ